ncbi:uncharacterized protein LOC144443674 [Glandiceps talaboti]
MVNESTPHIKTNDSTNTASVHGSDGVVNSDNSNTLCSVPTFRNNANVSSHSDSLITQRRYSNDMANVPPTRINDLPVTEPVSLQGVANSGNKVMEPVGMARVGNSTDNIIEPVVIVQGVTDSTNIVTRPVSVPGETKIANNVIAPVGVERVADSGNSVLEPSVSVQRMANSVNMTTSPVWVPGTITNIYSMAGQADMLGIVNSNSTNLTEPSTVIVASALNTTVPYGVPANNLPVSNYLNGANVYGGVSPLNVDCGNMPTITSSQSGTTGTISTKATTVKTLLSSMPTAMRNSKRIRGSTNEIIRSLLLQRASPNDRPLQTDSRGRSIDTCSSNDSTGLRIESVCSLSESDKLASELWPGDTKSGTDMLDNCEIARNIPVHSVNNSAKDPCSENTQKLNASAPKEDSGQGLKIDFVCSLSDIFRKTTENLGKPPHEVWNSCQDNPQNVNSLPQGATVEVTSNDINPEKLTIPRSVSTSQNDTIVANLSTKGQVAVSESLPQKLTLPQNVRNNTELLSNSETEKNRCSVLATEEDLPSPGFMMQNIQFVSKTISSVMNDTSYMNVTDVRSSITESCSTTQCEDTDGPGSTSQKIQETRQNSSVKFQDLLHETISRCSARVERIKGLKKKLSRKTQVLNPPKM